jgi:hypothetical protein
VLENVVLSLFIQCNFIYIHKGQNAYRTLIETHLGNILSRLEFQISGTFKIGVTVACTEIICSSKARAYFLGV